MFQFIGLRIRIKCKSNEPICFSPAIENLICFERERIFLIGIRYDIFSYHAGINFINFKNDIEMECLYVYVILMEENVVKYRIYYISKTCV